ncbi:MAG: pyridoxal phosphate-dependent aminotransferase [Flavobacteriaceae bacterium]|nr:pyridoxal phosphate-dependent aminotransferase [Flavobacteriaceae bacterium]
MLHLAARLNRFSESQTIGMAKLGRELAAKGHDVINLSFGEPDFQTPQHIKDAAKAAIDEGFTFYTPVAGYPELKQAISAKFKRDNNLDFAPDQVVVSVGAKHSIMNVVLCTINPGDECIIPTPYWVSYSAMIQLAEGVPVHVHSTVESGFKITPEQLEAAITPKTSLFIFSSPSNPTGTLYTKEELAGLAAVFERHPSIYIISDEIYEYINFVGKHESIAQFESIRDRVIVVNGVSKGFAMTGWRIGYIGASKEIAQGCEKIQGQFTSGAVSIAQRAAIAAISGDMKPTFDMRDAYLRRRDLVLGLMDDLPGFKTYIPGGAFYVFPDVSWYFGKTDGTNTINNAEDLCMYILNNGFVSLVPGEAFGNPNCIRFSYAAADEKLVEALGRIKEVLEKLR